MKRDDSLHIPTQPDQSAPRTSRRRFIGGSTGFAAAAAGGLWAGADKAEPRTESAGLAPYAGFTIRVAPHVRSEPLTARLFVTASRDATPEPRFALSGNGYIRGPAPFFGMDVTGLAPGMPVRLTETANGFPLKSLGELPPGDYYVQAIANVYTEVHRADGRALWLHMDHWEGQDASSSPGNLYSEVKRVHLDPSRGFDIQLTLSNVIPPIPALPDTPWIRRIKFKSPLISEFWGHPMYLGATILLPKDYGQHPDVYYPVVYEQTHFNQPRGNAPFGFTTEDEPLPPGMLELLRSYNRETGYELYKAWNSPGFPRMIAVTFQHPTPFYDDSYAINSANVGPYADAIMQELIPYVESHFRIIRQPYARVLSGTSTGGWESLALQIFHPEFFGGAWACAPDPVDFRRLLLVDIYNDSNAYIDTQDRQAQSPVDDWFRPERPMSRGPNGQLFLTMRQECQRELALGSHGRSADVFDNYDAMFGPVGEDGYPKRLWNRQTGQIDHGVAAYWREHGYDLRAYLAKNWASIAPKLIDKIHVDVGDMDNYHLNLAVYALQDQFESSTSPHVSGEFNYGRPEKGHGWQHVSTSDRLQKMADTITRHAPRETDARKWRY